MLMAAPVAPTDQTLPAKLIDDAIVEALCHLQFTSGDLQEVIIGRISDFAVKRGFFPERLPIADIPAPIRNADPSLRFQPTIQFRSKSNTHLIRIGENAISFHVTGVKQYPGWEEFKKPLKDVVEGLFKAIENVVVEKIALRYINAIVRERHFIDDIHQLEFEARVGKVALDGPINLNYVTQVGGDHIVTTRLAHSKFVQGSLPPNTSAVIDVEVTTIEKFSSKDPVEVLLWVEKAHNFEKSAFFALIPGAVLNKLKE